MSGLDRRLHAYRPDLAAESLKGRVRAARYVSGSPAQMARGLTDLRPRPEATAPIDTQLLFGETVTVYDEADGWAWVQNATDGYVGYLERAALGRRVHAATHSVRVLRTFLYPEPDLKAPALDRLDMTAPVAVVGTEGKFSAVRFGDDGRGFVYGAHLAAAGEIAPDFVATAMQFLGAPYLWGGRSGLGLDCSALVQLALARAGIPCPRDSDMQADSLGAAIAWEPGGTELRRGDLIYFPGHVAIALDGSQVLNANAHAMLVSVEPLADLEARVKAETGGTGVTAVRRLPAPA